MSCKKLLRDQVAFAPPSVWEGQTVARLAGRSPATHWRWTAAGSGRRQRTNPDHHHRHPPPAQPRPGREPPERTNVIPGRPSTALYPDPAATVNRKAVSPKPQNGP